MRRITDDCDAPFLPARASHNAKVVLNGRGLRKDLDFLPKPGEGP
jgi:hypothetical protein